MYINKYIVILIYLVFWAYNLVDIHQTEMLLSQGAQEANPIINILVSYIHLNIMTIIIVLKSTTLTILGVFLLIMYYKQKGGSKNGSL